MRKHEAIDLLSLYAQGDTKAWNKFLTKCLNYRDLASLEKVYYGLQAGMDDLVKKKANSEKIINWYIRLCRSIDITMKKIIKLRQPNPFDNPLTKETDMRFQKEKRRRDQEIERYIRKILY